jgi:hypothetical protein
VKLSGDIKIANSSSSITLDLDISVNFSKIIPHCKHISEIFWCKIIPINLKYKNHHVLNATVTEFDNIYFGFVDLC